MSLPFLKPHRHSQFQHLRDRFFLRVGLDGVPVIHSCLGITRPFVIAHRWEEPAASCPHGSCPHGSAVQESRCGRRLALRGGGGGEGVGTPRPDAEGSLGGLVEGTGLTVPQPRAAQSPGCRGRAS